VHFQEVVFYLIMCVHFLGNYTRVQLCGYGVQKNPSPIPPPKKPLREKYQILDKNPVEPASSVRKIQKAKIS